MQFLTVENRLNDNIQACLDSAKDAGISLIRLDRTEETDRFRKFKNNYVHLSTNDASFELICFRRYFLLEEHLIKTPEINRFVLLDSDILVYNGISEHIASIVEDDKFAGCYIQERLESECQISPHVSYWTREGLFEFASFLITAYTCPEMMGRLKTINNKFQADRKRGGISDMTLLYLWATQTKSLKSLNRQHKGNTIDHNISIPHNFHTNEYSAKGEFKLVRIRDGKPCFIQRLDNKYVFALALHFQGKAKGLMPLLQRKRYVIFQFASRIVGIAKWFRRRLYKITG